MGHEVTVIADEGSTSTVTTDAHVIAEDTAPGIARTLQMYHRIRRHFPRDRFDIVHSWWYVPIADVFSIHGIGAKPTVRQRVPEADWPLRNRLGDTFERFAKRLSSWYADRTVVTAPMNRRRVEKYGITADHVIPVGVKSSFIDSKLSVDSSINPDILCVGRVEPNKNQRFVVRATPDIYQLSLVGPESDSRYNSTIPNFEQYYKGTLPTEELLAAYSNASVVVVPSAYEGFSLTGVEAMARGTPIVVSDSCGIADYVRHEPVGGVFPYDDDEAYRSTLNDVYDNRIAYGQNAKQLVREKLNWDTIATEYESVYSSIALE